MRLLLVAILCGHVDFSIGQILRSCQIEGIADDSTYSVSITQNPLLEFATFKIKDDSINVFGVQEIEYIKVQQKKFIEVQYNIRGGSGMFRSGKVVVCAQNGRLHRALDIFSDLSYHITEVFDKREDSLQFFNEREEYHVSITIVHSGNKYGAILQETDTLDSRYNPSANFSRSATYNLNFDGVEFLFYNTYKALSRSLQIVSINPAEKVHLIFGPEVPCVQFDQGFYVLIDNQWCYKKNGSDVLLCR